MERWHIHHTNSNLHASANGIADCLTHWYRRADSIRDADTHFHAGRGRHRLPGRQDDHRHNRVDIDRGRQSIGDLERRRIGGLRDQFVNGIKWTSGLGPNGGGNKCVEPQAVRILSSRRSCGAGQLHLDVLIRNDKQCGRSPIQRRQQYEPARCIGDYGSKCGHR